MIASTHISLLTGCNCWSPKTVSLSQEYIHSTLCPIANAHSVRTHTRPHTPNSPCSLPPLRSDHFEKLELLRMGPSSPHALHVDSLGPDEQEAMSKEHGGQRKLTLVM